MFFTASACPADRCDFDPASFLCQPKPALCSEYDIQECPLDRCQVTTFSTCSKQGESTVAASTLVEASTTAAQTGADNDSCQYANDGFCDHGTQWCEDGTDCSDCESCGSAPTDPSEATTAITDGSGGDDDSCQYSNDGFCDHGTEWCVDGTDCTDCNSCSPKTTAPTDVSSIVDGASTVGSSTVAPSGDSEEDDSCQYANDGMCDHGTEWCDDGTDCTDCNSCPVVPSNAPTSAPSLGPSGTPSSAPSSAPSEEPTSPPSTFTSSLTVTSSTASTATTTFQTVTTETSSTVSDPLFSFAKLKAISASGGAANCYVALFESGCGSAGGVYKVSERQYVKNVYPYWALALLPQLEQSCGKLITNWLADPYHKSLFGAILASKRDIIGFAPKVGIIGCTPFNVRL